MPSSQHFYVVRFEEVVDMKSFPKRTPEGIKAGQALPFFLKAILLFFLFLAQLPLFLIMESRPVFANICKPVTKSFRDSRAACQINLQAASSKKTARKISKGGVKLSKKSFKYDGHSKKPKVTVKYGHKKLKTNKDYTVRYENNKKRGTAKVIIIGKGDYRGTISISFRIR